MHLDREPLQKVLIGILAKKGSFLTKIQFFKNLNSPKNYLLMAGQNTLFIIDSGS